MDKLAQIIVNSMTLLCRKIDALTVAVKATKHPKMEMPKFPTPVINIPPHEITVKVPEIKVPQPIVNIDKSDPPVVNIPAPIVNVEAPIVNVPPAQITVEPAKVEFPDEMTIKDLKKIIEAIPDNFNIFDEV